MSPSALSRVYLYVWLFFLSATHSTSSSHNQSIKKHARFAVTGPVVTITVNQESVSDDWSQVTQNENQDRSAESPWQRRARQLRRWVVYDQSSEADTWASSSWIPPSIRSALSSLSPRLFWSIRSTTSPLPYFLPSLRSASCTLEYQDLDRTTESRLRTAVTSIHGEPNVFAEDPLYLIRRDISATHCQPSPATLSTHVRFSKRFPLMRPFHFLNNKWNSRRNTFDPVENNDYSSDSRIVSETRMSSRYHGTPISLEILPTYHILPQQTSLNIQVGIGESVPVDKSYDGTPTTSALLEHKSRLNLVARLLSSPKRNINASLRTSPSSSSSTSRSTSSPLLQSLHGSYYTHQLPSFTSLQSLSIHPTYDFCTNTPTCTVKAKSASGRTTALFDFNWDDPTFTIIHDLDEYNTIAPQISLSTSSIVYHWKVQLENSRICTRVDPMSCIDITWTDPSASAGQWITHVQLPLSGLNHGDATGNGHASWKQGWRPNIRVRRTFCF